MVETRAERHNNCCVHGYHSIKISGLQWWEIEQLDCVREPLNAIDRFAVAAIKDGTVVGHLP